MTTNALALTAPLAFRRHLAQAGRSLAFVTAGLAFGVLYLVALPTALIGGAPAVRRLLELERPLAHRRVAGAAGAGRARGGGVRARPPVLPPPGFSGARIPALPPVSPEEAISWRNV